MVTTGEHEEERTGYLWVDAHTGMVSEAWGLLENAPAEEEGTPPEPTLDTEEARQKAEEGVLDLLAEEHEEVVHTGAATIFQKVRTTPQKETLQLSYMGLAYVPVWRVEGEKGSMLVDGITGEMLRY